MTKRIIVRLIQRLSERSDGPKNDVSKKPLKFGLNETVSACKSQIHLQTHAKMELPEDCIYIILKQNFSVSKLIRLRGVSHTWKKVVEKICVSKTELNLFCGLLDMVNAYKNADPYQLMKKADLKQLWPNLVTPSKTIEVAQFLARLFPRVTKLVCGLENSYQVAILLNHWSKSLEDLTFIGKMYNETHVRNSFWNALDSMPKLKRLHFYDMTATEGYKFTPYAYFSPPLVTAFNQLEYFAITGMVDQVYDIFDYKKPKSGQAVETVPQNRQNRAMAAYLTHLVLINKRSFYIVTEPLIIKAIVASTEAIRYLDVSDLKIKLTDLMSELQNKGNLESLRLKSSQLISDIDVAFLTRLNSVKRLHLIDNTAENWGSIYRSVPIFFPSLEHLEMVVDDVQLMRQIEATIPRSVVLTFISTSNN